MRPTLRPGAELECRLTGRKMHDYHEWNRGGGKLTLVYFSVAIFFICGGYFVCFVVSDDGSSFGRLEWMDGWLVGRLVATSEHLKRNELYYFVAVLTFLGCSFFFWLFHGWMDDCRFDFFKPYKLYIEIMLHFVFITRNPPIQQPKYGLSFKQRIEERNKNYLRRATKICNTKKTNPRDIANL